MVNFDDISSFWTTIWCKNALSCTQIKQYLFIFRQRRLPYFIPKYRFLCHSLCVLVTELPVSSEWRLKATQGSFSLPKIVFGSNWREGERGQIYIACPGHLKRGFVKLMLWYFQCLKDDWFPCTFSMFYVYIQQYALYKVRLYSSINTFIAISKDKTKLN